MLAEASVTTNDTACGQKGAVPPGHDDAGAFSSLRPFGRLRAVSGVERLLDDAFRCIACVAAT